MDAEPSQQRCCVCGEEITWPVVFWMGDKACHAKCTGCRVGSFYGFLVEADGKYALAFADEYDRVWQRLTLKLDLDEKMMKAIREMFPPADFGPPEAGTEAQGRDVDRITGSTG